MNAVENKTGSGLRPQEYWRLWLVDTVLVSAGFLFFLATRFGTYEFFGKACLMALLPLIPVLVLVGGAGSTVFALTKVWIEKHSFSRPTALALLVGPALAVTLALGLLGALKSPAHRLSYICIGKAPKSASEVRITGYSTFLREEWLAVFHADQKAFQSLVAQAQLVPAEDFEFKKMLERSALKDSRLFQTRPSSGNLIFFKRVFKEAEEHKRGSVYAAFDPATGTVMVFRGYRD